MATRRALSIGVARFDRHDWLGFAPSLVRELATELTALGYVVDEVPEDTLASAELGARVTKSLSSAAPDDLWIVHLVTHGEGLDGEATVFAIGSDGVRHGDTSIAHWLTMQQSGDRPVTLFLLDLCSAGVAARLPWQTRLEGTLRGWVIAGTAPNSLAYDGRFTRAVINVLRSLRTGGLDIDASAEFVPIHTVAQAIRREVNQLVATADAYPQQVIASSVDISLDDLPPFFVNPAFRPDPRLRLRTALDAGVSPFLDDLDEGLDAWHFIERGAGSGVARDEIGLDGLIGFFAGREVQLKQLGPWLLGIGAGTLGVVTGSPGVGKSALLGVLVCAAHPMLREPTKHVWKDVTYPIAVDAFAAVHARQRSVAAVVRSLAAQLGLGESDDAKELIIGIELLARPAVIVVDALDEAQDGEAIMRTLLLPLAAARRPADGSPAARLLVGTRRYEQFSPLLAAADADGLVVDLDQVPREVLMRDLERYVSDLLWVTRYQRQGGIRGAFATEVAATLSAPWDDEMEDQRWGEFLVAGLYTRYFVTAEPELATTAELARQVGADVPRSLPRVLELDLATRPNQPWLRPVLAALAHTYGQGTPANVLLRTVQAFSSATDPPTQRDIRDALDVGRFYLRHSPDADSTTLYRLFHTGLADYLEQHPWPSDAKTRQQAAHILLFEQMLGPLGPAERRAWSAAEPYVLRHAFQHAIDVGRIDELLDDPQFLLAVDPATLAVLAPNDNRVSAVPARDRVMDRRAVLACNAALLGLSELASKAANPLGERPLTWQPLWGSEFPGQRSVGTVRRTLRSRRDLAGSVARRGRP